MEYTKDRINDSNLVPRMSETRRDFFKYLIDVNMNSYSKVDNIIIKKSSVCEFRNIKNNDFVKIDDKKVWINGRSYQIRFDDKRSNDDILELKNQSLRWIYFDADLNNFESGHTIQASFLINLKYFSFDVDEDGNLFLSKIPECLSKFFYKERNDTYIANKNCPDIDSTWIIVGNNDEQIGYVYVKA